MSSIHSLTDKRAPRADGMALGDTPAAEKLIVALDYSSAAAALALVDRLEGVTRWVKVGLELYIAAGNGLVAELKQRGLRIFLDLKLHDIPNTVAAAVRTAAQLEVDLLTVHAAGGPVMLKAAVDAAAEIAGAPALLAVTVLTSMDGRQLEAIGVPGSASAQVQRLADLGSASGVQGFICSAEEIGLLRKQLGATPLLVIPGIRPLGADAGDQRRVATPAAAIAAGASYLVVGRPITRAADPAAAARAILSEMAAML